MRLKFLLPDWSDAYKHIHVREEDLNLQIISWGGKLFVDRSLTFGSRSSPGIYDKISNIIRDIANIRSRLPRTSGFKCLDDTGHVGSEEVCRRFYAEYKGVCTRVGVRLAPEDDPEKAFQASRSGTILGLEYNTQTWTWTFCSSKIAKIELLIQEALENDTMELGSLKKLSGKLNHYHMVVSPRGRWERGFLVYIAGKVGRNSELVKTTDSNFRSQLRWWQRNLQLSKTGLPIPDPFPRFRCNPFRVYPDAAGASASNMKLGMGGVAWNLEGKPMMMYAWPARLREPEGAPCFQSKLTLLEACAALATVCGVIGNMRGRSCVVYTDNVGLSHAWERGHSRCWYTYVIMKALSELAFYADCQLKVVWTRRCSSDAELVADLLSKGRLSEAVQVAKVENITTMRISRTLATWLEEPKASRELGAAICEEVAKLNILLPREPEDYEAVNRLMWKRQ